MSTKEKLRNLLSDAFTLLHLDIDDESGLHVGHKNEGGGHYHVEICAQEFETMNRVQQHRAVYAAVQALLENGVHALRISSKKPSERQGH